MSFCFRAANNDYNKRFNISLLRIPSGSWLAENGSKHALVINIGSVIALVSVFRQSCESLYLCNVLGDNK